MSAAPHMAPVEISLNRDEVAALLSKIGESDAAVILWRELELVRAADEDAFMKGEAVSWRLPHAAALAYYDALNDSGRFTPPGLSQELTEKLRRLYEQIG